MNNLFFIGFLLVLISLIGCTVTSADDVIRDQRITESQQWDGEVFRNPERVPDTEFWKSLKMFWDYYNKPEGYVPDSPLPAEPFDYFDDAMIMRILSKNLLINSCAIKPFTGQQLQNP